MVRIVKGTPQGKGKRIGIVVSRFNVEVTQRLLKGCLSTLTSHGVKDSDMDVVWVPGAVEIPPACSWMVRKKRYDALVALGAVIRGETPHFEYVALMVSRGLSQVMLDSGIPIAFGVLTTETVRQAMERSGKKENKGEEAALVALEMAVLSERFLR
ncbi:MAG: 6,7-dimethyl-8-ribityllumazine synthase [Candidatus Omnitrophica bacterium]|nr:6,7-dimethyl-8-ribityllumazine synthase [Candidatus Omnitrophota bacterium]